MVGTDAYRQNKDMLYQFLRDLREDIKALDATVDALAGTQGAQGADIARLQEQVKAALAHIEEMDSHGTRNNSEQNSRVADGVWSSFFASPAAQWTLAAAVLILLLVVGICTIYVFVTGNPATDLNPMGGQ